MDIFSIIVIFLLIMFLLMFTRWYFYRMIAFNEAWIKHQRELRERALRRAQQNQNDLLVFTVSEGAGRSLDRINAGNFSIDEPLSYEDALKLPKPEEIPKPEVINQTESNVNNTETTQTATATSSGSVLPV